MLESIEKLRDYISTNQRMRGWKDNLSDIANEIEAEISERYMLLPVDADGVPIRIGDKMMNCSCPPQDYCKFEVAAIGSHGVFDGDGEWYDLRHCRHVKPDSLKELLDDVSKGVICYPRERVTGYLEDNHSIGEAVMLDVRDRLRDLLGGDSE